MAIQYKIHCSIKPIRITLNVSQKLYVQFIGDILNGCSLIKA